MVKNTGELRKMLADLVGKIEKGEIPVSTARVIIKSAAEINRSISAEVDVARLYLELGDMKRVRAMGTLGLY